MMTTHTPSILPVYRRADVTMVRGEGVYLFDDANKRYLDFAAGIAVNGLGHSHPRIMVAMQEQAGKLWHCSNLYHNKPLELFSDMLVKHSFADSVFCCSSGVEAVEAAIKFSRRYHDKTGNPDRYRMIVTEGGFHGRTLTAVSASRNSKVIDGYAPLVDCFDPVPFNDAAALEAAITRETAAIMLEPIQGEGGVRPHSAEFIAAARAICDKHGLLLYLDEVQCGMARPGTLFAYERYGVKPDMVTIGKAIGNGFPLAACLVTQAIADTMEPGCHGSTYGSNPLAMAVGSAVLEELTNPEMLMHIRKQGEALKTALENVQRQFPQHIEEIRGIGLMLGIRTAGSAYALADRLRELGLLTAPAGDRVVRMLPPFIITDAHIEEAITILQKGLEA